MNVKDKLVLVTGASAGMGMNAAKSFAEAGSKVILLARRKDKLEKVSEEIQAGGGTAYVYDCDLLDQESIVNVVSKIKTELGVPDVIINNAGYGEWKYLDETNDQEIVSYMHVPTFAAMFITRYFLPEMLERNTGSIVNVTSPMSYLICPGATAYITARFALRGFYEALKADLANTNITVSLLVAGLVLDSEYWQTNPDSLNKIPKIARLLVPNLSSENAGKKMVQIVEKEKSLMITPFMLRTVFWQFAVAPMVVQWLMRVTGHKR